MPTNGRLSKTIRNAVAPYAAVFGTGYMGYMLMPAILSVLIGRFSISASSAGLAASLLLGSMALTTFASASRLDRVDVLKLAKLGCLFTIAGYMLAAAASSYVLALGSLCIAGAGMGMAVAGGDAMVSASENPDQLFGGVFAAGQLSAFVLLITVIPSAAQLLSGNGVFLAMAAWSTVMLLLLIFSRQRLNQSEAKHASGSLSIYLSPIVLALFVIGFSDASVWPFTGEVGASLGLEGGEAEAIQGFALMAGIVGASLAAFIGTKFGRRMPLITGLILLSAMYFLTLTASTPTMYAAAQIIALLVYGFSIPFLFGICSELDKSGRTMAAATGLQMAGLAIAPWVAGSIITEYGRSTLASVVLVSCLLTLGLALSGAAKIKKP